MRIAVCSMMIFVMVLGLVSRIHAGDGAGGDVVDFRYAPGVWQTAIGLPDDAQKTLVGREGELLYDYWGGAREFGTRVSLEITSGTVWKKQSLVSPRVPIVRTERSAPGLEIVEEAFAVTTPPAEGGAMRLPRRLDDDEVKRNFARPAGLIDPELKAAALHEGGAIRAEADGQALRVALILCEGQYDKAGQRVLTLRVEGAAPRTVDPVETNGKNKAAACWFDGRDADGDGKIAIGVEADPRAADKTAVLNGLWVFPTGTQVDDAALLAGRPNVKGGLRMPLAYGDKAARTDVLLVKVTNTGARERTLAPRLIVDTAMDYRGEGERAVVGGREAISASLKLVGPAEETKTRHALPLAPVRLAPGKSAQFFARRSGGGALAIGPATLEEALAARAQAVAYWEKAPLPYGRIQVPDAGVQALLDASIRNIWQAREIKKGLTAFQVGPTCYRGLWIVDGAFLLEAAAMLGAGDQARAGVTYELMQQKDDGRIEVLPHFSKENGIVLWTCVRQAQLMQDKAWLESVWPKLQRVAEYIKFLRQESLKNDTPLDDGLMPPGDSDGGIGGVHDEFTNSYWNLHGLRAYIEAARWLGKNEEAAAWQREYDAFMGALRQAAARDTRRDAQGNAFVPILMGEAGAKQLPQRAQWAFCNAVYPGQIFAKEDPLVAGNMAMLQATEREGMVYGTGWMADGLWNYFASFYGHAWLWQGNGRKAAEILYAYANHAAPILLWCEEQSLKSDKVKKWGDMPHNWASAEFIRLAAHLLELDRGNELHLFEGLPVAWTKAGMVTRLSGLATPFGKLTLELKVGADGKSARLRVEPLSDPSCAKVVVHLEGWASREKDAVIELDPGREHQETIALQK